ncbi:UvrD-helicase domain-containing protein [Algoriphagus sp. NF]|jgi:ATP-dependent exoDNAse (exonuclease V) beta subunit|uniref:UvrD-helicase domain-containing protein n=1 Tax=Algoriphagus sp. NF TaxID=2992756 RepID=UPI001064965B|nr:UvrD-helicase domain-containing protein [Algoriphagus sp. NF]MDE0560087.1 UvrD-helicase domain-containing protein [Algoriphagus sp. NF]
MAEQSKPFIIYKSSAGSGKTYTLTLEYLKLALQNPPTAFKQILAVTFTNKATQEMKERILKVLGQLSRKEISGSELEKVLMESLGLSPEELQSRAKQTLLHILHGYGYFAVSTIDSFFQRVIRSFAREMDLQAKFDLEMDTDAVLERLVDRLVEKVSQDKNLSTWLVDYAKEQIENEKSWDIRSGIKSLGSEIFKEGFKAYRLLFQQSVAQEGFLGEFRQFIRSERAKLKAEAESMRQKAEEIRVAHGLEWTDFKGGSKSFALRFSRLGDPNNPIPELTGPMLRDLPDPQNWYKKGDKNASAIESAIRDGLDQILFSWPEKLKQWNTFEALHRNLNAFGVFRDLILELRELKDEESILLISDVNDFLQEITKDNDTPFIYEKIGNQYRNFLIDEFQDTSDFQWSSFKPLLENSLASGNTNLLVGDVKQSIYRWRGGKLELLLSEVQKQIPGSYIQEKNLDTNYRSLPGIIRFNNALFQALPSLMEAGIEKEFGIDSEDLLSSAFNEAKQEIPEKKLELDFQGKIRIEFTQKPARSGYQVEEDEEEEEDGVLEKLPQLVKDLQDRGYQLKDIAFLVRKNAQGVEIADYLMAYDRDHPDSSYRFDVLSEESLFLDKSAAVKCLLALWQYLSNPSDRVALKTAWYYYALLHEIPFSHELFHKFKQVPELKSKDEELKARTNEFLQLPLLELIEESIAFLGLMELRADLAYISGFKEAVFDFVKNNRADLVGFLDWWELNKRKRTVKIPEDHDAMRILTIHKSKGLQFKVVIMPFLDWKIVSSGLQAPVIWSPFEAENGLKTIVPLTHGSTLKDSYFSKAYEDEVKLAYLDSLNMLYVGFTRAEEVVWGYSNFTNSKSSGVSQKSTGNVLFNLFSSNFQISEFSSNQRWDKEKLVFEAGEWAALKKGETQPSFVQKQLRWETQDWRSKLKTKTIAWDFSENGLQARAQRKLGVIVHELLAASQTQEEAIRLLQQYTFEGRIDQETANDVTDQLKKLFEIPEFQSWFGGDYLTLAEQEILLPGGNQKRPDRVLIGDQEVIVVDFKTGEKYSSHPKQVKEYMDLVHQLSQKPVKGFLCYLEPTEIIEV